MGGFSVDISKWCAKAGKNGRLVASKVTLDVGTSMVMKTPVGDPDTWEMPAPAGYVGGRARGSWQYQKESPLLEEPGTIDPGGGGSIDRIKAGVKSGDSAVEHFITSTVPYMRRLEYEGWSRQAPEGMVRLTLVEFQNFVNKAVKALP